MEGHLTKIPPGNWSQLWGQLCPTPERQGWGLCAESQSSLLTLRAFPFCGPKLQGGAEGRNTGYTGLFGDWNNS